MALISFRFNGRLDLNCDETTSIKDVCLDVASKLELNPAKPERGSWLLATDDGENYIQNPFDNTAPISYFRTNSSLTNLILEITPLCMHGSPSVPKKGFLCGWC